MATGFGRAQGDDVAARIAAALPGIEIEQRPSEYADADQGAVPSMLRLRLGARAFLDLDAGLTGWFVVPLRADALGSTPVDERQIEILGVSVVATPEAVAAAAVPAVRRWVDVFGPSEADAPFAQGLGASQQLPVQQPQQPQQPQQQSFQPPVQQPFAGQPPFQPYAGQPYPGQQQYPGQPQYPGLPYPAQQYAGQQQFPYPQAQYAPYLPVAPTKSRTWIVALAIGGSAVVLIVAVFVIFGAVWMASPSDPIAQGSYAHEPAATGDTTAGALYLGACFDFPADSDMGVDDGGHGDSSTEVATRDCDEYHDFEVYKVDLYDAADGVYPGDDDLGEQSSDVCLAAFEPYIGTAWEDSEVEYGFLYPSRASWLEGDRAAVCFAYLPTSDTDESLRGSGR
ncbi:septum formation family protein [Frigoribacterium sp. 2-23]|uniref:septum formation family protein n=1 Tax=Frigoribacterium sp. 2-23 TaxID=3415006 RepID=UPI003C6EF156